LDRPPDLKTGLAQIGDNATGLRLNISSCVPVDRHGNDALDLNLVYRLSHSYIPRHGRTEPYPGCGRNPHPNRLHPPEVHLRPSRRLSAKRPQ
jgi:hypothetical protein